MSLIVIVIDSFIFDPCYFSIYLNSFFGVLSLAERISLVHMCVCALA